MVVTRGNLFKSDDLISFIDQKGDEAWSTEVGLFLSRFLNLARNGFRGKFTKSFKFYSKI